MILYSSTAPQITAFKVNQHLSQIQSNWTSSWREDILLLYWTEEVLDSIGGHVKEYWETLISEKTSKSLHNQTDTSEHNTWGRARE